MVCIQYPSIKIPRKAADALLLEKCGLSLNNYWKDFTYGYVKAYDAYYYMHSREQLFPVAVVSGQIDENGHYIISYTSSYSCPPGDMYTSTKVVYSYIDDGIAYIGTRYDNVITGLCMYVFDTVYPATESARLAPIFEEIIDSIVLQPYCSQKGRRLPPFLQLLLCLILQILQNFQTAA